MRDTQSLTTSAAVLSRALVRRTISVAVSSLRWDVESREAVSRSPQPSPLWGEGARPACVPSAILILPGAACGSAGDLAEDGAGDETGAARVVEIEDAANQFARRIEAADRLIIRVQDFAVGVDAQAAEREGDAA